MPLLNDASAVLLGTNPVGAVYLGDVQVWPSGPPLTEWRRLVCRVSNSISEPPDGYFNIATSNSFQRSAVSMRRGSSKPSDLDGKLIWDNPSFVYVPVDDWIKTGEDVGFWHLRTSTMLLTRQVTDWDANKTILSNTFSQFTVDVEWNPVPFVDGDEYLIGRLAP